MATEAQRGEATAEKRSQELARTRRSQETIFGKNAETGIRAPFPFPLIYKARRLTEDNEMNEVRGSLVSGLKRA